MAQKNIRMSDRCYEVQYMHNRKSASDENGGYHSKDFNHSRYTPEDNNGLGVLEVVNKSCSAPTTVRVKSRRYDIPTLLDIGRQMEARGYERSAHRRLISVTSRKSNASQHVLRERSINHSRNSTCVSIDTEENHQTPSVQCPQRQPRNAPQGLLAQTNEGFAKFLKNHASPKHQRVTAGGRIVPMNPTSPSAPEFKLPRKESNASSSQKMDRTAAEMNVPKAASKDEKSDTGSHKDRKLRGTAESKATHSKRSTSGVIRTPNMTALGPTAMAQYQTPITAGPSVTSVVPNQLGMQFLPGFNHNQMANTGHPFQEEFPMSIGMTSPSREDQCGLVQPNLQQYYFPQIAPVVADAMNPSPQIQYTNQVGNIGTYANPSLTLANPAQCYQIPGFINNSYYYNQMTPGINAPQPTTATPDDRSSYNVYENTVQEFENLSSQLTNLDRYLALHSWDIDATNKKVLVAQRVELVTKLDAARVLKENLESVLKPYFPGEIHENDVSTLKTQPYMDGAQGNPYVIQPALDSGYGQRPMVETHQGQSPTSTEATGLASPIQTNGLPYRTAGSFQTDYQGPQVPNQAHENDGSDNWMLNEQATAHVGDDDSLRIITEANGETVAEPSGDWIPSPEINAIYRKIEQAAQRNEALGPLFRELAKVTALLNSPLTRKRPEREGYSQNCQHSSSRDGSQTVSMGSDAADYARGQGSRQSRFSIKDSQLCPQTKMEYSNPQASDKDMMYTLGGRKEAFRQKFSIPTDMGCKQHKGTSVQNSGYKSPCHGLGRSQSTQGCQSNSMCKNPQLIGPSEANHVLDKSTNGARFTAQQRQHSALSFSACRQNMHNRSTRKVETLASAQKINAQGFLPSYDGSGDPGESSANPSDQPNNSNNGNDNAKNKNNANTGQTSSGQGFGKGPRPNPDAMDVRAFFQMLRDEDREALRQYRGEKRMLG